MASKPKLLAEWFWTDRWMGSSAFLLPIEPRGLYREMLTQAWRRGCRLPNNHEAIRRAVGCTVEEWDRCWPAIERLWRVDGDSLVNDTQLEVWEDSSAKHVRAVERGRLGGLKRAEALAKAAVQELEQLPAKPVEQLQEQLVEQLPAKGVDTGKPPSPSLVHTHPARAREATLVTTHRSHAFCGVVCLPNQLWSTFLSRMGGDEHRLSGWLRTVSADWQARVDAGGQVPEGDDFAFWRNRWTESFGNAAAGKPAEPRRDVDDSTKTGAYLAGLRAARG